MPHRLGTRADAVCALWWGGPPGPRPAQGGRPTNHLARVALVLLALTSITHAAQEWRHWAGDAGATHYSPLKQINRSNVQKLKPAWTFHTGDKRDRPQTTIECTRIVV